MTAAELLSRYDLTVDQARDWIMANLSDPATVYSTALSVGCNSSMLAEIVAPVVPGVNAAMVESFFSSHGLDGAALSTVTVPGTDDQGSGDDGGSGHGPDHEGSPQFLPDELDALAAIVRFNAEDGLLSTASLRNAVQAATGVSAYEAAFSPTLYEVEPDGRYEIEGFGSFDATAANLESIFFGTMVYTFKAIDAEEIQALVEFTDANLDAIANGNPVASEQFFALVVAMFEDPADPALFGDGEIAEMVVDATVLYVELVASGSDTALFGTLPTAWG